MSHYAVTRNAGPAWTDGKCAFEQPGASDHAAFAGNTDSRASADASPDLNGAR